MSPADELRAAAQKIRDTAKGATPGPWQVGNGVEIGIGIEQHSPGRFSYDALLAEVTSENDRINDVEDAKDFRSVDITVGSAEADAAWIALASPQIAEPIAAWLEGAGCDLGGAEAYLARTVPGEIFDPFEYVDEPDSVRAALAVARAINGGAR
ncbi:hypothetical protein [Actinomadura sediminis]|uniref:Uncharacterized protein n=1 Tax=Actinomadura sediminis TaxID=1038904 RepID=A0ABW3EPU1_9ACTN